jgi:hypothetical protein
MQETCNRENGDLSGSADELTERGNVPGIDANYMAVLIHVCVRV